MSSRLHPGLTWISSKMLPGSSIFRKTWCSSCSLSARSLKDSNGPSQLLRKLTVFPCLHSKRLINSHRMYHDKLMGLIIINRMLSPSIKHNKTKINNKSRALASKVLLSRTSSWLKIHHTACLSNKEAQSCDKVRSSKTKPNHIWWEKF